MTARLVIVLSKGAIAININVATDYVRHVVSFAFNLFIAYGKAKYVACGKLCICKSSNAITVMSKGVPVPPSNPVTAIFMVINNLYYEPVAIYPYSPNLFFYVKRLMNIR